MSVYLRIFFIALIPLLVNNVKCNFQFVLPKITPTILLKPWWSTTLGADPEVTSDFTIFRNESFLLLNGNYSGDILLHCDASYPVTWTMSSVEHKWVQSTMAERKVVNISDPSTYTYSILLKLVQKSHTNSITLVGKFECESITTQNFSTSVSPSKSEILIAFERKNEEWVKGYSDILRSNYYYQNIYWNSSQDSHQICIPCFTTNTNEEKVKLYLHTGNNRTLRHLEDDEVLRVEPYVGYFLHSSTVLKYNGQFVCALQMFNNTRTIDLEHFDSLENLNPNIGEALLGRNKYVATQPNNSIIIFNVTSHEASTIDTTLTFEVDEANEEYRCCSSTNSDSTSMSFVSTECNCPILCLTRRMMLQQFSLPYFDNRKTISKCRSQSRSRFFYMYRTNPMIYSCADKSRGRVSSTQELRGKPKQSINFELPSATALADGNEIMLTCKASSFYFAKGMFFEIQWKNQSTESILGNPFTEHRSIDQNEVRNRFKLSTEISNISCRAPLWNSSDWVTNTLAVNVQAAFAPWSSNSSSGIHLVQNISFFAGERVKLDCEFEGVPKATYTWNCSPANTISTYSLWDTTQKFPSRMTSFGTVKTVTVGVMNYSRAEVSCDCKASNDLGIANKQFYLTALESKPLVRVGAKTELVVLYNGHNNQNLSCGIITGSHNTQFNWMKFELNISSNAELEIRSSESESFLIFKKVQLNDEGEYFCNVTNFMGFVEKKFIVKIKESTVSKIWVEVILVLTVLMLVILSGFWFYKNRRHEKRIKNLQMRVEYFRTLNPAQSTTTISSILRQQ